MENNIQYYIAKLLFKNGKEETIHWEDHNPYHHFPMHLIIKKIGFDLIGDSVNTLGTFHYANYCEL